MSEFSLLDGAIVGVYIALVTTAGIAVRKYVGKVEHFLVAGREVNVYLGIASLAATEFGIVTCMYCAQNGYDKGFSGATPGILMAIAMFVVGLTGFGVKPLRDSGVMTIPQLFEKRFGKRIRSLSGLVIVLGGLLNMGVFLRKGGDFLVHVTGLPEAYLEETMTALLILVATYTILGGMISVIVTDFLQFVVMSTGILAVTALILVKVGWSTLTDTVTSRFGDAGFNPFIADEHMGTGWAYVVFNALLQFAVVLTWQTTIQRLLSAKDTRTGRRIYIGTSFFFVCRYLIPALWGIAALALLAPAEVGEDTVLAMPKLLGTIVPIGLMGILVAAMLAADMSTNSTYMLTWASVIYNDIIAPWRARPWSERRGLLVNRITVGAIGVFLLAYGLWYRIEGDLWTYLGVTGTIYLSSMSVLLIACCYWKKANSGGAAAAIVVGAAFPTGFLILEKLEATAAFAKEIGPYYSGIAAYIFAAIAMVVGSLLARRRSARKTEGS
ncbi:MAG: sodium:solute symporter family protein [Planctomycetes bacterium]|nr:sodium:solute symporter family protein [Planctomycetota bacterium]